MASKRSKTRLKWTEAMNTKLLECKRKAKGFVQSKDPLRMADGKKHGYMAIMKQLCDNSEFADLNISTQESKQQLLPTNQKTPQRTSQLQHQSPTDDRLPKFRQINDL